MQSALFRAITMPFTHVGAIARDLRWAIQQLLNHRSLAVDLMPAVAKSVPTCRGGAL
jgi:hypothetical protein